MPSIYHQRQNILALLCLLLSTATAFTVAVPGLVTQSASLGSSVVSVSWRTTRLYAADPEDDEESLDLDLGEMFDMFDAADKDEDFDDAMKKVKSDDE